MLHHPIFVAKKHSQYQNQNEIIECNTLRKLLDIVTYDLCISYYSSSIHPSSIKQRYKLSNKIYLTPSREISNETSISDHPQTRAMAEILARYPPPPRDTIHPWQTHGKWAEVSHVVRSQILKGPVAPVRENVPASQLETNGLLHNRGRHKAAWAGVEVERRDREGQREEENGGGGIAVEYVYPFLC